MLERGFLQFLDVNGKNREERGVYYVSYTTSPLATKRQTVPDSTEILKTLLVQNLLEIWALTFSTARS